ncbi:MAG: putative DNA-binding domain-containing protein [Draconibacterium sp.]|nr:putative DNA-binding domain-containing protein [Draconibacterium sp.]
MLLKTETYNQQSNFAQYCRDGKDLAILGAKQERLPHYRRLIFNVVKDAMETTFPISFKYIETEIWDEMVYNFFSWHKCSEPQVWRMPEEFFEFCKSQNYAEKYNLPFLFDLLYFEWLEVELYMMEDIQYPKFKKTENWLTEKIAVNPEHKIVKLEYPVHLEKPFDAANKKGDYFLLIYREKESGRVQFANLSVLFTFLVENIVLCEQTLEEIFNDILYIFGINDLEMLQTEAFTLLRDLQARGFVLGVK